MKKTLLFSCILLVKILSCQGQTFLEKKSKKPNILILLADDLGYGEIGSYGQKMIKTPVLDGLANKGIRFTNFYAGNAVCSPSRAVLMTGKSSATNSIRGNLGILNQETLLRIALRKDEKTLGEMVKENNYQTAFIGKWHLENPYDLNTWAYNRGFDFAIQEQWGDKNRKGNLAFTKDMEYIDGMKDSIYYDYKKWNSKDEFRTSLALDYLDTKDTEKPFLLFMSYRAPHGHERVIGNKDLYAEKGWPEKERMHAAKITLLDTQIGKLVAKLKEMGELENTLILFTSDNGPTKEGHDPNFFNSNGDFSGIKRDLYEGGIRVPLIAFWKGKIEPGTVSNHLSGFQDILPTLAEITQSNLPENVNGISFLPTLLGNDQKIHNYLNWEILIVNNRKRDVNKLFRQSARIGKWKGVRYGATSKTELYNIDEDISETHNVALKYPEIVKKMNAIFKEARTEDIHYPFDGFMKK